MQDGGLVDPATPVLAIQHREPGGDRKAGAEGNAGGDPHLEKQFLWVFADAPLGYFKIFLVSLDADEIQVLSQRGLAGAPASHNI